jgi:hypothetical protein
MLRWRGAGITPQISSHIEHTTRRCFYKLDGMLLSEIAVVDGSSHRVIKSSVSKLKSRGRKKGVAVPLGRMIHSVNPLHRNAVRHFLPRQSVAWLVPVGPSSSCIALFSNLHQPGMYRRPRSFAQSEHNSIRPCRCPMSHWGL